MKNVKISLVIFLLCSFSESLLAKDLRIGIEAASKPFAFKSSDDKLVGFDVDIANALCDQLNVKCVFVEQEWKGIIPGLQTRKYDAIISSMSITEERKKSVDFTDKYYHTPARLIAKLSRKIAGTPASLKDKKVGVLQGSTHEVYANEVLKKSGSIIIAYTSQNEVFLDLKSGRIDATLVDSTQGKEGFLTLESNKEFGFIGPVFDDPKIFGFGAGIAIRKGENDLRLKLNAAIKAIRTNGIYKKIQIKYFDFDVYGS
jgi:arginine/ornithine transport system substrate-binding protein